MTPKEAVAQAAANLIQPKTIVGLGSGSTAALFIRALAARHLPIQAVASSAASAALATSLHIPLLDLNDAPHIDLTVDGADAVDPQKRLIKGGGGAHTREKILASSSRSLLIIIDSSKLVDHFSRLPVEILPYGSTHTYKRLTALGYTGTWRDALTDNGNRLLDLTLPAKPPELIETELRAIPGVVETGLFLNFSPRILVGHPNGTVTSL